MNPKLNQKPSPAPKGTTNLTCMQQYGDRKESSEGDMNEETKLN